MWLSWGYLLSNWKQNILFSRNKITNCCRSWIAMGIAISGKLINQTLISINSSIPTTKSPKQSTILLTSTSFHRQLSTKVEQVTSMWRFSAQRRRTLWWGLAVNLSKEYPMLIPILISSVSICSERPIYGKTTISEICRSKTALFRMESQ